MVGGVGGQVEREWGELGRDWLGWPKGRAQVC